ncbi:hypothetical protein [Acinetobacter lactucae]|uniref:hypothetical protein n=1 Tax=Acinetobacter lactucae TaxID=1785128 RepID=UPI00237B3050|nr:hypothetical protein [Acinetobacter lactucae]MDD9317912.1 hypothetical protein [Acinetobacter lactucae]
MSTNELMTKEALIAQIEEFKKECMELWFVPDLFDSYQNMDLFSYSFVENGEVFFMREQARQLWKFWNKAKDQAVPDSSILIAKSDVKTIWQDDEEPENIVNKESDFNVLGDCLDFEDVISITKQDFANIYAQKVFGTWVGKLEGGELKKDYFFVGSQKECEEIVEANKSHYPSRSGA